MSNIETSTEADNKDMSTYIPELATANLTSAILTSDPFVKTEIKHCRCN